MLTSNIAGVENGVNKETKFHYKICVFNLLAPNLMVLCSHRKGLISFCVTEVPASVCRVWRK